ncbi:unnamed protein product, partial [Symbiodinium sp. CCMP2456]
MSDGESSSDYEQDWDNLERDSMRALEARLAQLDDAGQADLQQRGAARAAAASSTDVASGERVLEAAEQGFVPGPHDDLRQMRDAVLSEPYRPEDHVLTQEEMWAGFSSEEEAVEAPLVMEVPAATNKGPSEAASRVPEQPQKRQAVLEMSQPSQPSSQACRQKSGPFCQQLAQLLFAEDLVTLNTFDQICEAFDASQLVDAGRLLENACLQEPYRPEDHELTAEEFWGGTSDSSQERQSIAALPAKTTGKLQQAPLAETEKPSEAVRLERLLSAAAAPTVLADLSFVELGEVARDCLKAAETLQWVLNR